MKRGLIITLPRWDDVTEYLSQFSLSIIEEANSKDVLVKQLNDKDANRKEFEKVIDKLDYNFVVFNGHGSGECIKGHKDEVIIKVDDNESKIKGRIVYARACEAGEVLGKFYEKDGEKGCFIGYDVPFKFWADSSWAGNPSKDNTAKLFLEPSNLVPISILKGHNAQEANENSKKQMLKNLKKIIRSGAQESFLLAEDLWNNYDGQVLYGNPLVNINSSF